MLSVVSDLKFYLNMFNTAISFIIYGMIFSLEEGGGELACLLLLALRATYSSISVILVSRIPLILSCR